MKLRDKNKIKKIQKNLMRLAQLVGEDPAMHRFDVPQDILESVLNIWGQAVLLFKKEKQK